MWINFQQVACPVGIEQRKDHRNRGGPVEARQLSALEIFKVKCLPPSQPSFCLRARDDGREVNIGALASTRQPPADGPMQWVRSLSQQGR